MGKKVYYLLRSNIGKFFLAQPKENKRDTYNPVLGSRVDAGKFRSVTAALSAIQRACGASDSGQFVWPDVEIIRVEETPGVARRELVTTGDLSLLDGPVVLRTRGGSFVGSSDDRGDFVLADARVFSTQRDALDYLNDESLFADNTGFRIVPIREIPGTPTIVETVLA